MWLLPVQWHFGSWLNRLMRVLYIVNFDVFVSTVSDFSSFAYTAKRQIGIACAIAEGTLTAAVGFIV